MSEFSEKFTEKVFPDGKMSFAQTDPEFYELFSAFAFDEAVHSAGLDEPTRFLAILASLTGCGGTDAYREMLPAALSCGVPPEAVKEMLYQATAYLGFGKVLSFLKATNEIFAEKGIPLPSAGKRTVFADRAQKGEDVQVEVFGEGMRGFSHSGKEEVRHVNFWLSANCFGDYYTRTGLNVAQREMITFCFLMAQGGCEPQLIAHAKGNMHIGNDKNFLICVVSQCLPYVGYPRSLNALRCIEEAAK